jgi:MOSC domain
LTRPAMRPVPQRTTTPDGALSACLAALLEAGWEDTPAAPTGEAPLARWQEWLAERNLRIVETAALPAAGFWIGELPRAGRAHHVVMFGSPPDVVWDPAEDTADGVGPHAGRGRGARHAARAAGAVAPRAALVLAALDPTLPVGRLPGGEPATGTVAGLFVAEAREAPCRAVEHAEAVSGRGLRGDRYFDGEGTFGAPGATGHELTLIAAEALEALAERGGPALAPADARRNVLTRGVDVEALVGRRFRLGDVECVGRRWCEPCAHLQRLTAPGVLRGLVHRGGLRADIVTGGTIAVGDSIRAL